MGDVNVATVINTYTGEMDVIEVPYGDDILNVGYLADRGYLMDSDVAGGRGFGVRDGVKYEFIFGV